MLLTAQQILNISFPGEVFTGNIHTIKAEYAALAKRWHPDVCCNAYESNQVMSKINALYKEGLDLLGEGCWEKPGFISFKDILGRIHEIHYHISHPFELGKMYIGDNVVVYMVDNVHRDLFLNALSAIKGFTYANTAMEAEISRYLPKIIATFETSSQKLGLVIGKTPDSLLLKDVLLYYDGGIPDVHTAWILSSLYHLACYIDFIGLGHHGISPETCFISPKGHTLSLLGGWWYAIPQGRRMLGLPQATYAIMSPEALHRKCGAITVDLECIHLMGRQLLGDTNGTRLTSLNAAPKSMIDHLRGAVSKTAHEEYSRWDDVLVKSFGRKRFVDMHLSAEDLYSKIKEKVN